MAAMEDVEPRLNGSEEAHVVLTLAEAAAVLRIGRSAAYELARRYLATGGTEGLPVLRLGRYLRVPRSALERMISQAYQ
jgi:hypothetical protein